MKILYEGKWIKFQEFGRRKKHFFLGKGITTYSFAVLTRHLHSTRLCHYCNCPITQTHSSHVAVSDWRHWQIRTHLLVSICWISKYLYALTIFLVIFCIYIFICKLRKNLCWYSPLTVFFFRHLSRCKY